MSEAMMMIKNDDIHEDVLVERQCPSCWRDDEVITEGTIPRETSGNVIVYFCKAHENSEMPQFCSTCKRPLIEMHSNYFCYECGKIVSKTSQEVSIIKKKKNPSVPKKELKVESLSLDDQIIQFLKDGPKTRNEMVIMLKKPRTTIHAHLKALEKKGLVIHAIQNDETKVGRPLTLWALADNNKNEKKISRRSTKKPLTKILSEEKCEKHPGCIFFTKGKCQSMERISFIWCDGSFIPFSENPTETDSVGSKHKVTKNNEN